MTDSTAGAVASLPFPVLLRAGEGQPWVEWELALRSSALEFKREKESVQIKDSELSGISLLDSTLVLHAVSGAKVYLQGGTELTGVMTAINSRVCTLGEVTRPLRAFGARKGRPGQEHDQFFEPLMSARAHAEKERGFAAQLAAFDATSIKASFDRVLHAFATTRYPNSAPESRALFETINERARTLHASLDKLGLAAMAARHAPEEERFSQWRSWVAALDATFAATDQCWLDILPLLERVPPSRPKGLFGRIK